MRARRPARVALVLCALAGAACGLLDGGDTLTDAQQVVADMKIGPFDQKGAGQKGADQKGADQKEAELTIIGAVDHAERRYRLGEPIALSVEVNKAAHVAVLRVMPNGAATLIYPNRRQATAQVPANAPLRIPEPGTSLTVTTDKPGTVLFEFIAASRGASWLFNRKPEGPAEFVELGSTTRALAKDIVTSLGHGADTAASHVVVRVAVP